MRFAFCAIALLSLPADLKAQMMDPRPPFSGAAMPSEGSSVAKPPPSVPNVPANLAPHQQWPEPTGDNANYFFLLTELLEYRANRGTDTIRWDIFGWYGGDLHRVWFKTEGNQNTPRAAGEFEGQLLYGRQITPFFDFQAGVRYAQRSELGATESRTYAAIGVQGLAPYSYSLEPTLFVSQDGNVSARATATYDLLLTQRLILQPRFEVNAAVQSDRPFGIGSGLNDIELGLRLRYEIHRKFAPYIGISWRQRYGETSRLFEAAGNGASLTTFVTGVRLWM